MAKKLDFDTVDKVCFKDNNIYVYFKKSSKKYQYNKKVFLQSNNVVCNVLPKMREFLLDDINLVVNNRVYYDVEETHYLINDKLYRREEVRLIKFKKAKIRNYEHLEYFENSDKELVRFDVSEDYFRIKYQSDSKYHIIKRPHFEEIMGVNSKNIMLYYKKIAKIKDISLGRDYLGK